MLLHRDLPWQQCAAVCTGRKWHCLELRRVVTAEQRYRRCQVAQPHEVDSAAPEHKQRIARLKIHKRKSWKTEN